MGNYSYTHITEEESWVQKETRWNKKEQTNKNRLLSHKHEQEQKLLEKQLNKPNMLQEIRHRYDA